MDLENFRHLYICRMLANRKMQIENKWGDLYTWSSLTQRWGFTKESGRAELCFLFKNWLGRVVYVPSERMFHNRRSPAMQARPSLTIQDGTPPARTQVNTNLSCNSAPSLFDFRYSAQCDVPFSSFIILENWKWTDSWELPPAALSHSVPCVVGCSVCWDLKVPVL